MSGAMGGRKRSEMDEGDDDEMYPKIDLVIYVTR
jgi:hypothetical protein